MIPRNHRPEDLESPVRCVASRTVPAAIDTEAFTVRVSLADRRKPPQSTVPAHGECTANGRGFYGPKVPGIQWMRGAIGNAEWRGPRGSDARKMAGVPVWSKDGVRRGQ